MMAAVTLLEHLEITQILISFHRYCETLNYGCWQQRSGIREI